MDDVAKERVRTQYGAVGDAYVRSVGHATGNDLQRMLDLANPRGVERLLDLATGGGHVARVFSPHVTHVVASDLTPGILHHAAAAFAEWGLTNVSTEAADAEALPFADASFDIVTCRIAPHHFPNQATFVTEVARVLTLGGQFVLVDSTVPEGEDGAFFNRFENLRDPSHVRSLTIAAWQDLLEDVGFAVAAVESFRKRHQFDDWVTRSRTSADDRQRLSEMMLTASAERQAVFDVEIVDGKLVSFSDTKTLFHAVLP